MNFLDILFPHPCIYCGKYTENNEFGFCEACSNSLPMKLNIKSNTWYLFEYDKKIASLLKLSKYAGKPYYIRMLASIIGNLLKDEKQQYDMVVFVPMHRKGIRTRGYNQSYSAACVIAKKLKIPVCDNCLKKIRRNRKQAGLGKGARKLNVKGVYKGNGSFVKGKSILLVDDIMTTGSTLNECEKELRYVGATRVSRVVIAYTPVGRNR